jgi:hypothetical protein
LGQILSENERLIIFRKKLVLIREGVSQKSHPLNMLLESFKVSLLKEKDDLEMIKQMINDFVDLFFTSLMDYYKFKNVKQSQSDLIFEMC